MKADELERIQEEADGEIEMAETDKNKTWFQDSISAKMI